MAFEHIVGQERLIGNLKKVLLENRVSHAYLVEGLKGVGKKQFAKALSKAILCHNLQTEELGSEECSSCKKIKENNHTELHLLDIEGSIKIEEIREIQKSIHIKPYEGSKKVYVILNGEKMTQQAQNALLKTLEEPPGHSVIIITTNNIKSLLPTIISRCQLLKLKPQGVEKVREYLVGEFGIDENEARVTATFSNGLVETAIRLYNNEEFKIRRLKAIEITGKLLSSRTMDILNEIEFFNNEKSYIEEIIDILIYWYRDILVYKETSNEQLIINSDQLSNIYFQVRKIENTSIIKEAILMLEEKKQQIKGNVNYSLAMETMLLNLQDLFCNN